MFQIGKDKYSFMQDRNGKLCVFIDCMNDDYVGTYTCLAVNDEGEATMKIKLLIAGESFCSATLQFELIFVICLLL